MEERKVEVEMSERRVVMEKAPVGNETTSVSSRTRVPKLEGSNVCGQGRWNERWANTSQVQKTYIGRLPLLQ